MFRATIERALISSKLFIYKKNFLQKSYKSFISIITVHLLLNQFLITEILDGIKDRLKINILLGSKFIDKNLLIKKILIFILLFDLKLKMSRECHYTMEQSNQTSFV